MTNSDLVTDMKFAFFMCDVKHRKVLDIGATADANAIDIAPNDDIVPNGAVFADVNVAKNYCAVAGECARMDSRFDSIEAQDTSRLSRFYFHVLFQCSF